MSYRDPVEAARARRDALGVELARLDEDDPKRQVLESELAALHETIEASRTKLALSVLSSVRIATPCAASWAAMTGDDRVRHCALCEKNVYDLAGLTAWESLQLLAEQGEEACVRLHRRRDGTVLTADCDVGRRRRRKRASVLAAGSALVIASAGMTALPTRAPMESPVRFESSPRYQSDPSSVFYRSPPAPNPERSIYQGMIIDVEPLEAELPLRTLIDSPHDSSIGTLAPTDESVVRPEPGRGR